MDQAAAREAGLRFEKRRSLSDGAAVTLARQHREDCRISAACETFRGPHQSSFVMPNPWDGASAVLLARLG